jgi:WD40 repeat protein
LTAQDGVNHQITWEQTDTEILFKDITAAETITLTHAYIGDDTFVEEVALSPDGNYFATGMMGADILIWDLRSREIVQTLRGHEWRGGDGGISGIRYLAFSPQNDLLVSVGYDGTTRLWNIHSGLQLQKLNICCFAEFSPDGRILVTAGQGVIRVWGIPPWP